MKIVFAHFVITDMHWRKPWKSAAELQSSAECSLNTTAIMQVEVVCPIFDVILSTGGPLYRAVLCKGLHAVSEICVWLFSYHDQCLPAWVQTRVWRCSGKYGVNGFIPSMNKRSSTITKKISYVLGSGKIDRICSVLFILKDIRPMNVEI
jgi:hypothetical protein